MNTHKTIVVMPAYNAEATLERTIADIPFDYVDEIILVDDASSDDTVLRAKDLIAVHPRLAGALEGQSDARTLLTVVQHLENKGYGGNQKTCYSLALKHGADIVVMLHPDYQYDPKLIKHFVEFISEGYFDVLLGSRIRSRAEALAGGMPAYKYFANRFLTLIENAATGRNLSEWHTGMRAYRKAVLESIDYLAFSDDFVFDTQALFAIIEKGFSIGDIPVPVRYFAEASSINLKRSAQYGLLTLIETGKYILRTIDRRLRYVISGGFSVLTNLLVYTSMLYAFHIWYVAAAFIGFWGGAITSFTLQKYWSFGKRATKTIPRELGTYGILMSINAAINSVLLFTFVHQLGLNALIGNSISNVIVAFGSYFVYKHVIFPETKVSPHQEPLAS
jgi:glycosyltransferase involved in cell wall biosynthesis